MTPSGTVPGVISGVQPACAVLALLALLLLLAFDLERPALAAGDTPLSFDEALTLALDGANRAPADTAVQLAKVEALLGLGRPQAAAEAAIELADRLAGDAVALPAAVKSAPDAASTKNRQDLACALRLWMTARLRQALPLDEPRVQAHMNRLSAEPALSALRFWSESLAGRAPYRIAGGSLPAALELKRSTVWSRFHSRQLEGIEAAIGDATLALVFIDTGAQYTMLSVAAARAAGVVAAGRSSEMVGFATFDAVPAMIPELRLGSLVVRDVPVFVGDSPALARAKGQMAIGTDLLHHLRFTLDLDAGRAAIEPTAGALPLGQHPPAGAWQVRLWPLAQTCLAEAHLAGNRYARVLIDTGNWEGTFVSARWARRNDVSLSWERLGLWVPLGPQAGVLSGLELGGHDFDEHPVRGRLPAELDRLDLLDIIVGHDVLDHHRLTIDLAERLLRCERTLP